MKKYLSITQKLISSICIFTQAFLLVGIPSVAYSSDDVIDNSSEAVLEYESSSGTTETLSSPAESSSPDLEYTITAPFDPTAPMTTITFDKTNIDSFTYEAEGLTVIENTAGENNTATYILTATKDFGTFEIAAHNDGAVVANKTIYTYCKENTFYTSEASKDIAWHKYMQKLYDENEITVEEWHNYYSAISLEFSEEITDLSPNSFEDYPEVIDAISAGKIVVGGRMTWETKSNVELPMRFTKVELRKQQCIDLNSLETYTDENGYYYFILDPDELSSSSMGVFVRTYTESTTFGVFHPSLEIFNFFDSHTKSISASTSGIVNISQKLINDSSYMPYRLAYIQQGMVVGQEFALDMGMVEDKNLYVYYLGDLDFREDNTEEENLNNLLNELALFNNSGLCFDTISLIGFNSYNSFDTAIHEYGHYVENRIGTYGNAVKNQIVAHIPEVFDGKFISLNSLIGAIVNTMNDYSHDIKQNNFDKTTTSKQFQMELTWSEAWATIFAKIAFENTDYDYTGISLETDPDYENFKKYNYDGEASEYAVASFLWDLYDGIAGDDNIYGDYITMTAREWWDLTTETGTYTLQNCTTNIIDSYPELIDGVGKLLTNHNISPNLNDEYTSPCSDTGKLVMTWSPNGGNSYPNDKFKIVFYDKDNNIIEESDVITINDDTSEESEEKDISITISTAPTSDGDCICTVSTDLWLRVLSKSNGGDIYATVYGYRSGTFDSGPYFSNFITVWDDSNSHRYEKRCDSEGHWDVCICGAESPKASHEITYSYYTPTQHYKRCDDCAYMGAEDHNFVIQSSGSASGHQLVCVCGETRTEAHYSHSYVKFNNSLHAVYCECGYLIGSESHQMVSTGLGGRCTHCGYTSKEIPGPGQIILGEEDEDPTTE